MSFAWSPSGRYLARSRLRRFAEAHGHRDFPSLHRWSVEDLDGFWRAVDRDIGLVWKKPYDRVLDTSRGIPWTTWWLGGRLNFVASALRHDPSRTAIIFEGEEGTTRRLTYGELAAAVRRCAAGLRALGVHAGDRVGIFLPLTPECAIATLAVAAIGAIYTPIFSGYASDAIAGRLRDCDASVLITADGFRRRGQVIQIKETADAALDGAPSVRTVVVVRRLSRDLRLRERDVWWDDMMAQGSDESLADTSPEDPYMLIYTSGTTGRPKGAVHVHGGFPIKAAQDLAHVFDLQSGDLLWWFTDIGWMMGPWLIAGGLRKTRTPHQLFGRHRVLRGHPWLYDVDATQADGLCGSCPRDRGRRGGRARQLTARGRGRARHSSAVAGHDARVLARSREVPGDLLEPASECLGARRLGTQRRRRFLVHRGPQRRHAQGGGQARGTRGNRIRGDGAWGGARSGGDRRAARAQRRGDRALRGATIWPRGHGCARRGNHGQGRGEPRQTV